jgi:hypothetical protein
MNHDPLIIDWSDGTERCPWTASTFLDDDVGYLDRDRAKTNDPAHLGRAPRCPPTRTTMVVPAAADPDPPALLPAAFSTGARAANAHATFPIHAKPNRQTAS